MIRDESDGTTSTGEEHASITESCDFEVSKNDFELILKKERYFHQK